jgi:hypothetical protein
VLIQIGPPNFYACTATSVSQGMADGGTPQDLRLLEKALQTAGLSHLRDKFVAEKVRLHYM